MEQEPDKDKKDEKKKKSALEDDLEKSLWEEGPCGGSSD